MRALFRDRAFDLLDGLARDNTKDWYQAHKAEVEAYLLVPFADALEAVSAGLGERGVPFRGGKETMFRMNRDVRFSADKSPYKTNVSGLLTPDGTKQADGGCVYLQLDAGGGFAAYGRYGLDAKALGPIRERIVAEPEAFAAVLDGLRRGGLDLDRRDKLKAMPRGFAGHADHPHADELKLTSVVVRQDLPKAVWKSGDVVGLVVEAAVACRGLMSFVSV